MTFRLQGSISLCASDNNFKGTRLLEVLTGVCAGGVYLCVCVSDVYFVETLQTFVAFILIHHRGQK